MSKRKLKAISLFSGAGGDTIGFEMAGVDVVAFSEFQKDATNTHLKNFKDCVLIGKDVNGDITKTTDEELKKYAGKIDIIFAGFPCQGFSHGGKKDPNDERNKLFWEFVRVTKIIKPRWVIGENVKGLLERKGLDGKPYSDVIVKSFRKIGYNMNAPTLVNTSEYGVPQARRRIFFIGSRKDLGVKHFKFPEPTNEKNDLKKIIKFDLENSIKINLNEYKFLDNSINQKESKTKQKVTGAPHPYLLLKMKDKEISFDVRKSPTHVYVVNVNKPAKTVITAYSFQPRAFVVMKQGETSYIRTLNIKELQQIQGFPKSHKFLGTVNQQIKQIGNAVPPKMVKEIIEAIKKQN